LSTLPAEKNKLLQHITQQLSSIPNMQALVLGGSYSRGTARPDSDLDIGLYYLPKKPFEIEHIRQIALSISFDKPPTVTNFYGWGPWVNGGAWILTQNGKVDFLYRNLSQVEKTIEEAKLGITHHDFYQQPTFGFYSVIYLAETHYCRPLYDPYGWIARLKEQVNAYPPHLKTQVIHDSLWVAEFTLSHAHNYARRGDIYNTVGCLTRIASMLSQALFALNETFFCGDKTALQEIGAFPITPNDYTREVSSILAHPGDSSKALSASVARIEALWQSIGRLSKEKTG
jgi:hypothetical protein